MTVLESTGKRTYILDQIYHILLSVPLTSTEVERSFSPAGLFITKLCTSLNDTVVTPPTSN